MGFIYKKPPARPGVTCFDRLSSFGETIDPGYRFSARHSRCAGLILKSSTANVVLGKPQAEQQLSKLNVQLFRKSGHPDRNVREIVPAILTA